MAEAVQYTGSNLDELRRFVPEEHRDNRVWRPLGVLTPEGAMEIRDGDWVVKKADGGFVVCRPVQATKVE
jgi:hypothetical protein